MRAPSGSPWPSPLNASGAASVAHRTVALQKNGGRGIQCRTTRIPVGFRAPESVVLGGFPTLRRTLLKPLRNLALLLVFLRVIKFLSPLSLPISPPGRVTCEALNYVTDTTRSLPSKKLFERKAGLAF